MPEGDQLDGTDRCIHGVATNQKKDGTVPAAMAMDNHDVDGVGCWSGWLPAASTTTDDDEVRLWRVPVPAPEPARTTTDDDADDETYH